MASKAGVGRSDLTDSVAAGREAAQRAVTSGGLTSPAIVLLFCTSRHNPAKLREGVRAVVGPAARLIGGYGVGIITHEKASYDGHEVGVAVIQGDDIRFAAFCETGLPGAEEAVGDRLGTQFAASHKDAAANLLLLYDTVYFVDGAPRMNMATSLLAGLTKHLKGTPALAGMGMLGDMQLQATTQFFDDRLEQQSAILASFAGNVRMDTVIMHGCRPAGRYHEITRAEGPVVLEIDGKPALTVIQEMLGPDSGLTPDDYAFFVTLGVNKGDRYGEFKEDDYANRMCIAVDAARQGLIMFENDLKPGMQVQLMRRSLDFSYIGPRTRELLARAEGRKPLLAFYIDCAGRAGAYCGMDAEEADEVRKAIPSDVPLLGVYSGVEIARVAGQIQALDWTGVLCLFSCE